MNLRLAEPADSPVLAALVERYWAFERIAGFERPRVEALLDALLADRRHGLAWLAFEGTQAVGYLVAVQVFSLENGGRTAEIDEFFVLPSHRGRGVGERLLAVAERTLAAEGCTLLALQLGRGNDAARAFYARRGYRPRAGYELLDKPLA